MVIYRAERALSPLNGSVSWVVVDDDLDFHAEANGYLAALRARDCSPNTERVYASRVALYLSNCDQQRIDWRALRPFLAHAPSTPAARGGGGIRAVQRGRHAPGGRHVHARLGQRGTIAAQRGVGGQSRGGGRRRVVRLR